MVLFSSISEAPPDAIFGVTAAYHADQRPNKVNLGVGVYRTAELKPALLDVVRQVEIELAERGLARPYLPIDGVSEFTEAISSLVLGEALEGLYVAQVVGSSAALRLTGEFLARLTSTTTIYLPNPSWANHKGIFSAAGLEVRHYDYYNRTKCGVAMPALLSSIEKIPEGSPILFHASCHNPTGADPTQAQWEQILAVVQSKGLIPIFDCAYQGLGDGLNEDVAAVRAFAKAGLDMFICYSCAKNFGLYSERVGALHVLSQSSAEAEAVGSQVRALIRATYSNPPCHGQRVVDTILGDEEKRKDWLGELTAMRGRLNEMRNMLMAALHAKTGARDFGFLATQKGLFSFIGLERDQVQRLVGEYAIYTPPSGRINVSGLNSQNIDYVSEAIAAVL